MEKMRPRSSDSSSTDSSLLTRSSAPTRFYWLILQFFGIFSHHHFLLNILKSLQTFIHGHDDYSDFYIYWIFCLYFLSLLNIPSFKTSSEMIWSNFHFYYASHILLTENPKRHSGGISCRSGRLKNWLRKWGSSQSRYPIFGKKVSWELTNYCIFMDLNFFVRNFINILWLALEFRVVNFLLFGMRPILFFVHCSLEKRKQVFPMTPK